MGREPGPSWNGFHRLCEPDDPLGAQCLHAVAVDTLKLERIYTKFVEHHSDVVAHVLVVLVRQFPNLAAEYGLLITWPGAVLFYWPFKSWVYAMALPP